MVEEHIDDEGMICNKHLFKNNHNNPGGICAVCLQEKLGHLVSSSLPNAAFPSSASSSSFRSESTATSEATRTFQHSLSTNNGAGSSQRRHSRLPFLTSYRRKNAATATATLQRSKSTASTGRGFWSFLYYSKHGNGNGNVNGVSSTTTPALTANHSVRASSVRQGIIAEEVEEGDESPGQRRQAQTTSDKVSRSRSVGCGSRSFSGDFFERISTGLGVGDCTIRRVESQRQSNVSAAVDQQHRGIKERVRCGGIFGGFNLTSSSSSSSSSSQWVPPVNTAAEEPQVSVVGRMNGVATGQMVHGRSRSWAWALASPLRAFAKPTTNSNRSTQNAGQAAVPSPSILSVSS